jgi:hypothetical protein
MEKTMHNKSQTNSSYFQNLDAISGMKELSDEAAATCSGGKAVNLTYLQCLEVQDGDERDEIVLKINGKEVWGNNEVSKGDKFDLGSLGNIKDTDTVEVLETDFLNPDDLIGSFKPKNDSSPVTLNRTGKYKVGYKSV